MDIIDIVIAVALIVFSAGFIGYFKSFIGIVFPTYFSSILLIIITILIIKFIIGRNHG